MQACPPSAWYRFRKLARRNKGAFLAAAAVVAAMLLGVGSLVSTVLVLAASNAQVNAEKKQTDEALKGERQAKEDLERTAYIQRIALAGRELAAGNVGRAEELLDDCPEHLRGWEWHFLKRQRYGKPDSPTALGHGRPRGLQPGRPADRLGLYGWDARNPGRTDGPGAAHLGATDGQARRRIRPRHGLQPG